MQLTPSRLLATLTAVAMLGFGGAAVAKSQAPTAMSVKTQPPAGFKKVSTLVKIPEFLPGLGVLWVNPSTLPAGPFLGYDKKGQLVNVTYMLPLKEVDNLKSWSNLGDALPGLTIDHTDVMVVDAHPGVPERHVHVVNWLIPHDREVKEMGSYPHAHH